MEQILDIFTQLLFVKLRNNSESVLGREGYKDVVDMKLIKEVIDEAREEFTNTTLYSSTNPVNTETKNAIIDENIGWIPCSKRLPNPFENVQVTHLGFHDNQPHSEGKTAFVDETGRWMWTYGSNIVCVPIIAWRENLPPYQPKTNNENSRRFNGGRQC